MRLQALAKLRLAVVLLSGAEFILRPVCCEQGYGAAAQQPAAGMFSQGAASGSANSHMGRPGVPAGQQAPAAAPVSYC